MTDFNPEILIHMAAQPLVRDSYKIPVETYSTNLMGTVNVLESARYCNNLKSVIIITTDKCYENIEKKEVMLKLTQWEDMILTVLVKVVQN